jgi:hypothetical protein
MRKYILAFLILLMLIHLCVVAMDLVPRHSPELAPVPEPTIFEKLVSVTVEPVSLFIILPGVLLLFPFTEQMFPPIYNFEVSQGSELVAMYKNPYLLTAVYMGPALWVSFFFVTQLLYRKMKSNKPMEPTR